MKAAVSGLTLLSAILFASAAAAQVAGPWRVSGAISDRRFSLDCRFEPHGAAFGGVCTEIASGDPKAQLGKAHVLTQGLVVGQQVRWSYPASYLLAKFEISFAGTLAGDQIAGTVSASGRTGEFTAVKK
jgi:hypothetical protein